MKPEFTVTEVKDWINGIIADYRQLVKGELPDSSDLTYDGLGNIEMLEYIRDNYFSAELLNCILDILNDVLDGEITKEEFDAFMERGTK